MQHSAGPRIFGEWPLFAIIGNALALWFTLRIVKGIASHERDSW
jgi:ubiquinone biosynthesis protein